MTHKNTLKKMEQRYKKEQREIEIHNSSLCYYNNVYFCYGGESATNNDNEKKQHFYSKGKNIKIPRGLLDN